MMNGDVTPFAESHPAGRVHRYTLRPSLQMVRFLCSGFTTSLADLIPLAHYSIMWASGLWTREMFSLFKDLRPPQHSSTVP